MRYRLLVSAALSSFLITGTPLALDREPRFSALPTLGDADREILTPLAERKLGEKIMHEIRRDKDFLDDAPTLEYLNKFGNILVDARSDARGEAAFDYFFRKDLYGSWRARRPVVLSSGSFDGISVQRCGSILKCGTTFPSPGVESGGSSCRTSAPTVPAAC